MRRFIRSFFVKRRAQVTVIQDSTSREFVIYLWRAGATGLHRIKSLPYDEGTLPSAVRPVAIAEAKRISETERGDEAATS